MSFTAKQSGYCGHCAKAINTGDSIVKISPHRIKIPGRYEDYSRPVYLTVNYGHAECAEKVKAMTGESDE